MAKKVVNAPWQPSRPHDNPPPEPHSDPGLSVIVAQHRDLPCTAYVCKSAEQWPYSYNLQLDLADEGVTPDESIENATANMSEPDSALALSRHSTGIKSALKHFLSHGLSFGRGQSAVPAAVRGLPPPSDESCSAQSSSATLHPAADSTAQRVTAQHSALLS